MLWLTLAPPSLKTNGLDDDSSFEFSLFGVTTARKYFPLLPVDFVSFLSSNPFHVFSCQIHPPSPWPFSFPSTWRRHLHHRFSHVVFSPFHVAIPAWPCIPKFVFRSFAIFAVPLMYSFLIVSFLVTPSARERPGQQFWPGPGFIKVLQYI